MKIRIGDLKSMILESYRNEYEINDSFVNVLAEEAELYFL